MSRRVSTAPLLLPLLLAVIAAVAGQTNVNVDSPALHRLNQRVIEAFNITSGNEVVCTFCLFQVVSAAYQIGNADVQREIKDALGRKDPVALSEALLVEASRLPTFNGTLTGYYQHGALSQCPTRTKPEQCASIEKILSRRGQSVNFRDRRTVNIINTAVERATDGKIRDLFTSLAPSTELVFASTLVFHDKWESRLTAVPNDFVLSPGGRFVTVPTLINEGDMPVLDSPDGVQGVSMAYENPAIRLYCFVAKEEGADITQLLYDQHYRNLTIAPQRYTQVRMPQFDLVSKRHSYAEFMKLMGMQQMFLGGLGPRDVLKVDQLVHKAVIQTDEDGTSAAGAAGIAFVPLSAVPEVFILRFNKPFICSLVHERLGQPLFTAYITDPRKQ